MILQCKKIVTLGKSIHVCLCVKVKITIGPLVHVCLFVVMHLDPSSLHILLIQMQFCGKLNSYVQYGFKVILMTKHDK